jgi:hypothetical protein
MSVPSTRLALGTQLLGSGSQPGNWECVEEAKETLLPATPLWRRGIGGVAWSHFQDLKSKKIKMQRRKKTAPTRLGRGNIEAKLYKTSKFCMDFAGIDSSHELQCIKRFQKELAI